ncbi:MAG: thymidylate synthase, flavin-dependent [Lentisphaerae bacterium RIFOXYC12_FULL_60_16]|nr:MAG: thymidylate synthase, flavin-dependent [Lentisphaerae bacterium RIFOXYC12_FULL_60_16]OGV82422.1 MAG: thymidylate synthase, flavin-dependent [Lentisphaerae bacterium RIFOXYB12_FULL_60_10]
MDVELVAITPDAEAVIERAARTCYQSADRATTDSAAAFLPKLLAMGHESPFEHAYATFRIAGCSRAASHQLVRHRLMAVSQRSQRYVSEKSFDYVVPPSVPDSLRGEFEADMESIRQLYVKWKSYGLRNEDARFVLPNACTTELVISANFREFRHIFKVRLTPHAQWEIRAICRQMLESLAREAPTVFRDIREAAIKADPQRSDEAEGAPRGKASRHQ